MKKNIKATSMKLTDAVLDYLNKKFVHIEKFLDKDDDSIMCYIELGKTSSKHKSGDIFKAEANIDIGGKVLRAVSEQSDLYKAIDDMEAELNRLVTDFKKRKNSLTKKVGAKVKKMIKGI
jgi:ribosomal subunit interface protein